MRTARAGKERWVVTLMNAGKPNEAVAYMAKHGMIASFAGAPEHKAVGAGAMNLATGTLAAPEEPPFSAPANLPKAVIKRHVFTASYLLSNGFDRSSEDVRAKKAALRVDAMVEARRIGMASPQIETSTTELPDGGFEVAVTAKEAEHRNDPLPDFAVKREVLPAGKHYARITREFPHLLQKEAVWEEDFVKPVEQRRALLVWMGLAVQADAIRQKGRLVGQVFPVEKNPDDLQGGYRVWKPF